MSENQPQNLSILRNVKLGLFHLGSGMADVLATGVWNRIMISDLGYTATPISLLLALRYFLAPLGIWSGHISDRRTVGGYRRLFWIWLGRIMMAGSVFSLGLSTAELARGSESSLNWIVIIVSLLLFSIGNALSGSTFLALIYDLAPEKQRGRAVGLVWAFLLLGFSIAGFFFGVLLPSAEEGVVTTQPTYTPETLEILFIIAGVVFSALWFFPLLGEEKRAKARFEAPDEPQRSFREDLKLVWNNRTTRLFFWFLVLSFMFVFAQDAILEPFGGEVFGMDAKHTTRFAAYWGSMAIISTLVGIWLPRRFGHLPINTNSATGSFKLIRNLRRGLRNLFIRFAKLLSNTTKTVFIGVAVIAMSYAMFAFSGLAGVRPMVTFGLVVMGLGLGIWNVGTLGMMMELSPTGQAGTFLGFWSMVITLARGLGVSSGGVIHDVTLSLTTPTYLKFSWTPDIVPVLSPSSIIQFEALAYIAVFVLSVIGLVISLGILQRINLRLFYTEYQSQQTPVETSTILAGAMD